MGWQPAFLKSGHAFALLLVVWALGAVACTFNEPSLPNPTSEAVAVFGVAGGVGGGQSQDNATPNSPEAVRSVPTPTPREWRAEELARCDTSELNRQVQEQRYPTGRESKPLSDCEKVVLMAQLEAKAVVEEELTLSARRRIEGYQDDLAKVEELLADIEAVGSHIRPEQVRLVCDLVPLRQAAMSRALDYVRSLGHEGLTGVEVEFLRAHQRLELIVRRCP